MPRRIFAAAASIVIASLVLFLLDLTTASNAELAPDGAAAPVVKIATFVSVPTADSPVVSPTSSPVPMRALSTPPNVRVVSNTRTINGIPLDQIIVLPEPVKQNIRLIFAQGSTKGRDPRAFSKVGDSTMAYPPFLAAFDGSFHLGAYTYLQPTINRFAGSFSRGSRAVRKGMHTWSEFDVKWVEANTGCAPGEGPLACELRQNNPSIAIIRLGANDVSSPRLFDEQLRRIVRECLVRGIVPVLGTKPDRGEGADNTLNRSVIQTASSLSVPLWDYDRVAATVPDKGLEKDKVHIRGGGSHDYSLAKAFSSGDSLEDLTALMMLDAVRLVVASPNLQ